MRRLAAGLVAPAFGSVEHVPAGGVSQGAGINGGPARSSPWFSDRLSMSLDAPLAIPIARA